METLSYLENDHFRIFWDLKPISTPWETWDPLGTGTGGEARHTGAVHQLPGREFNHQQWWILWDNIWEITHFVGGR